jgi:hypothetical protein
MARRLYWIVLGITLVAAASGAHATLMWAPAGHYGGAFDTASAVGNGGAVVPGYDPSVYGGAPLQAVRFDVTTTIYGMNYGVSNIYNDDAGLATFSLETMLANGFDFTETMAEQRQTWSQWFDLNAGEMIQGDGVFGTRSTTEILTTNLNTFSNQAFAFLIYGVIDEHSWTGSEATVLGAAYSGEVAFDVYYGYDDGTPSRTPEPGTLALLGAGLPAVALLRRKRPSPTSD